MRIKIYLDEDVPISFAHALLNRGVDAVTTQQAKHIGLADNEQLVYAAKEERIIFTHNKRDFILLHNEFLHNKKYHAGIVLSDQLPTGVLLKRFMKLWFLLDKEDMRNRLEFLSNWK